MEVHPVDIHDKTLALKVLKVWLQGLSLIENAPA
jgi:hypothetical protein